MSAAKFIKGPILFNEAKIVQKEDGKFILAGRFALAEDVNENVRVYTKRLWANILARPSVKQMIKDKRMLGQLGHPDTVEPNLENVSHAVTYLELKDNGEIYGEAEVFDTPAGKILKILYNAGVRLGISSRGYIPDDVDYIEGVGQEVPDEYELVGFDFVIDPSTHGAFPVLKESTKKQLNKIVLESKQQLGKSLCESVNKMLKSSNSINLSFSLNGCSPIRKKQIRGLMEGKYPEATFIINGDELQVSDLGVKHQIAVSSDFNKLLNENNFIKRVNADSSLVKEKEVNEMPKVPSAVSKEEVLAGNYELAQEVIAELLKDKELSTEVIEDLVNRYKISEAKVAKLSKQLKSRTCNDTETEKIAESVIEDLKNRYLIAEEVIEDLVSRYNAKSKALRNLQKKYNMAEAVVSEMRQTTVKNRKGATTSAGEETSEEIIAELVRRVKTSEEVIAEMRDRYLLAENIIKDLTGRYTLSEGVISEMAARLQLSEDVISQLRDRNLLSESVISEFKSAYSSLKTAKAPIKKESPKAVAPKKVSSKAVTESKKVTQVKKTPQKDYSEYPYTPKAKKKVLSESVKSVRQTSPAATRRAAYEDKLASIVASVQ